MLPRFLMVLWIPLVVVACFAFPSERADAEEALASWYGPGFAGLPTATGEPYDPFGYTAAHKTMPLGSELLVSYGGSSVEVTVNDRGPYVGDRELDLSQGAAEAIGLAEAGVDYVQYASIDQYAVPPASDTAVTQSTAQYAPTTSQESGLASTSQYVVDDQYSTGVEPATAEAPVDEPALVEEPAPVAFHSVSEASVPDPVYYPPGSGAGVVPASVLVVRPGETLSEIAVEMGVSVDYLAAQNQIADPNFIYAGQVLYY